MLIMLFYRTRNEFIQPTFKPQKMMVDDLALTLLLKSVAGLAFELAHSGLQSNELKFDCLHVRTVKPQF